MPYRNKKKQKDYQAKWKAKKRRKAGIPQRKTKGKTKRTKTTPIFNPGLAPRQQAVPDNRPKETVEDFFARGGKVTKVAFGDSTGAIVITPEQQKQRDLKHAKDVRANQSRVHVSMRRHKVFAARVPKNITKVFEGHACVNCFRTERYVSSGGCTRCVRARAMKNFEKKLQTGIESNNQTGV